jgi:hypothetical protein
MDGMCDTRQSARAGGGLKHVVGPNTYGRSADVNTTM